MQDQHLVHSPSELGVLIEPGARESVGMRVDGWKKVGVGGGLRGGGLVGSGAWGFGKGLDGELGFGRRGGFLRGVEADCEWVSSQVNFGYMFPQALQDGGCLPEPGDSVTGYEQLF